jgi:uncharacterized membrane protein YkoI
MTPSLPAWSLALALGLALDPPGPDSLGAGWGPQQDEARDAVRHGRLISLAQAIGVISRRAPGRQLDAGLETQGPRQVYRVRWMTNDGRRIDYIVDAINGAILSEH